MERSRFSKVMSILVPTLVIMASLALIVVSVLSAQSYANDCAKNEKTISSLEATLNDLKHNYKEASPDEIRTQLYSAASDGNAVAEIQNSYKDAYSVMLPDESAAKQHEIYKSLESYFTDKDGQNAWLKTSHDYTWQFKTTYSVTDSVIPCLFLCYEKPDDVTTLMAYTTATYNAESGKFYDVDVNITAYGNKMLAAAVTPGATGATE